MESKGRRTDVESTAFWAAAAALIPANVFENRKGRAIMRLLDVEYRVVKKASSDTVFAGEHFPEGFYLVKIKWFQFVRLGSSGERCYRLVDEERMLSVHSLIRCDVKLAPPVEKHGRGRHGPLFTLTSSQCSSVMNCAEIQDDGSD